MSAAKRGWLRRHAAKLLASGAVAALFVFLLSAGALPLTPDPDALERVKWWTVPAYTAVFLLVHVVRAARWHYLLAPIHHVPMTRVLTAAFIGFAAIVIMPVRTGEVARPLLIRKRGEISGWVATGTVGAERVIDGLFLTIMLFVALQLSTPLDPLPDRIGDLDVPVAVVPGAAYAMLAVFVAAFVTMGVFYWRRALARRVVLAVVGVASMRLATWIAERVEKIAEGLGFLPRWRYSLPFLGWTATYWLLNAAAAYIGARGVGFEEITFAESAVMVGVVALGILVPNAPGFFGAFQFAIYAALAMFFARDRVLTDGSVLVFLVYTVQLGITLLAASIAFLTQRELVREALRDGSENGDADSTGAAVG